MRKVLFLTVFAATFTMGLSQTIDNSFQPKLISYSQILDAVAVPDDKVFFTGDIDYVNGVPVGGIVLMGADGEVDQTFNSGTGAEDGNVQSIIRDAGGKLLVFGTFTKFNGTSAIGLVRLNPDGSIDNSFTSPIASLVDMQRNKIISMYAGVQSTGKTIVAFSTMDRGNIISNFMVRLNADGSKDDTFAAPALGSTQAVYRIRVLENDNVLASGNFLDYGGVEGANHLVRLNADGTLDITFAANIPPSSVYSVGELIVLTNGKIVIGRNSPILRLNTDGSPDNSFAPESPIGGNITNLEVLSDGSIITSTKNTLQKYSATGALVTTLNIDDNAGSVFNIGNDKLLTGFHDVESMTSHKVRDADLNESGYWDAPMIITKTYEYNLVNGFHLIKQSDKWVICAYAKIYTAGDVTQLHRVDGIFRVNSDFSFDESFHFTPPAVNHNSKLLFTDSNDKIYVSQNYSGSPIAIHRLNSNGSVDENFEPVPGNFYEMDEIRNGEYVGVTSGLYSDAKSRIIKFDDSGTIDNSIDVSSDDEMETIDVASNGKWFVSSSIYGWDGITVNGYSVAPIFRLNDDGSIDDTFSFGSILPTGSPIKSIKTEGEKVVAVGRFHKGMSEDDLPVERWSDNGTPDLIHDSDPTPPPYGHDLHIDGNHIYLLSYTIPYPQSSFQLSRMTTTGRIDKRFAPIHYRDELETTGRRPDRIYPFSENSFLVIGNGIFKIDIPGAPSNAPSNLQALNDDSSVSLSWNDNSVDESVFEIERAEGTGDFDLIGTVDADITNFVDNSLGGAASYTYRIKAANAGGESDNSNTATAVFTGMEDIQNSFSFFPNPVKDKLQIQAEEVIERFTLFQLDGCVVESGNPRSNEFTIDMNRFAAGLYLVKLDHANGKKVLKIFKQ